MTAALQPQYPNGRKGASYPRNHQLYMMDQSHDPAARRVQKTERSCIVCHQRKLRCNKQHPCSRCVNSGVLCYYPDSEGSVPKRARTTLADLAARLAQLERTIIAISDKPAEVVEQARQQSRQLQLPSMENIQKNQKSTHTAQGETLIQDDSASYYVNDILLSHILDEVGIASPGRGKSQCTELTLVCRSKPYDLRCLSVIQGPAVASTKLHPCSGCLTCASDAAAIHCQRSEIRICLARKLQSSFRILCKQLTQWISYYTFQQSKPSSSRRFVIWNTLLQISGVLFSPSI